MHNEHVISDELMHEINLGLANGENWMAYNTGLYFLQKEDVYFFKDKADAHEFAENNISDVDSFKVIHFDSVADLLSQMPYGNALEMKINDPDVNGLHNKEGNDFTDALIDHWEKEQIINNKKNTIMNDKNLEYLKDNIKYLGFGEKLYAELENNMKHGKPEFQLKIETEFNKDKIGAELHFKKSDTNDMYFFNRYDATLEKANKEQLSQTIYLNKGQGITMKETYNLLNGRAVNTDLINKAGEKYNAWIQLDLEKKNEQGNYETKQFHQNYGYDIVVSLQKYPIKELLEEKEKERLIASLQRGNLQVVIFQLNGSDQKMFIEANPQFKTLNIYDKDMKLVQHDTLKKDQAVQQINSPEKQVEKGVVQKDKDQNQKEEVSDSKKNFKGSKKEKNESLIPKKGVSNKKGQHV
ncbi:MAG: hypothetical protein U0U33_16810 [Chitinophagaceae bacterium]